MTDGATPAVQMVDVTCAFGENVAVRDLDLALADGEFFSLIGSSGCGKSTTLRMIAGLQEPTDGHVVVGGRDVTGVPPHRRPVNTVFQDYALFPHLDVSENVAFGLRERRVPRSEIAQKVAELLDVVGLGDRGRARIRELSGGQQQRVALARALVLEPAVLLLDEPLGALDLKLRRQMQLVLKQVQSRVGITFLYVTHDQEEAFAMSDRVGVMSEGVLTQVGTPQEIYGRPANLFVADFVGASNFLRGSVVGGTGSGYEVRLTDGGAPITVPGVAGLAAGTDAAVVVRPEAIDLGEGPGTTLTGRLVDASFLGSQTVYTLAVEGSGDITVAASRPMATLPSPGDPLRLSFAPGDAWLVADDFVVGGDASQSDASPRGEDA
jgi:spermidine/putrescine transport system ATP-binding protein